MQSLPPEIEIAEALEKLFTVMVEQQQMKVGKRAKALLPDCTWEEVMNPDSVPELHGDPYFNYEDGILAGTIAAQIAVRAELRRLWDKKTEGSPLSGDPSH
jgi:hypothetical protein